MTGPYVALVIGQKWVLHNVQPVSRKSRLIWPAKEDGQIGAK